MKKQLYTGKGFQEMTMQEMQKTNGGGILSLVKWVIKKIADELLDRRMPTFYV